MVLGIHGLGSRIITRMEHTQRMRCEDLGLGIPTGNSRFGEIGHLEDLGTGYSRLGLKFWDWLRAGMRIRDRVEVESRVLDQGIGPVIQLRVSHTTRVGGRSVAGWRMGAQKGLRQGSKAFLLAKGFTNAPGPRLFSALSPAVTPLLR